MMAKENQAVTSELTRLVAERDDGRRKLGDALHNQSTAEQVCVGVLNSDALALPKGEPLLGRGFPFRRHVRHVG